MNVDSSWGQGKTYFLSNIGSELREGGSPVAFVDAWATDFSDDPLTAIMSAIDAAMQPYLKSATMKNAWRGVLKSGGTLAVSLAKNAGIKLATKYVGDFGDELADVVFAQNINKDDKNDENSDKLGLTDAAEEVISKIADSALSRLIEVFRKQERSIITFKNQLSAVARSINTSGEDFKPIYVLVDELDRCRPTYAIRLLESIKHLFETDGVVFIIATDTEQLSESVKAIYGNNFDSSRYLRRFFDRTYRFRDPKYESYIRYLFDRFSIPKEKLNWPSQTTAHNVSAMILYDIFGSSLRDADQCFDMLQTFCTMWDKKVKIELGYALFLIALYHAGRIDDYLLVSGKVKGKLSKPFFERPSQIFSARVSTGYGEAPTFAVHTTSDLLSAYHSSLGLPLSKNAERDYPQDPIAQHIFMAMREEFQIVHHNRYQPDSPPVTVLTIYHRYVELADRLAEEPAA